MKALLWRSCLSAVAAVVSSLVCAFNAAAASEAKLTPACKAAKSYIELIGARDVNAVRDLFAENAEFTGPNGIVVQGRDKIAESYERGLNNPNSRQWRFRTENLLPFGSNGCLLEFSTAFDQDGQFNLAAVDRFEVDEQGKVTRFLPYIASSQLKRIAAHVQSKEQNQPKKP